MPNAPWLRRLISIPAMWTVTALVFTLLPVLVVLAAIGDVVRRGALLRTLAVFAVYLGAESLGIVAAGIVYVAGLVRPARALDWNYALQARWNQLLTATVFRAFSLRLDVHGAQTASAGPYLMFVRHVSTADTMLPVALVAAPFGLRPRYILKHELAWDPCLDIVGHRVPNVFVRRGDGAEAERVAGLGRGLGPRNLVVLFPEGQRFTPRRRQERIDGFASSGRDNLVAQAQSLQHTLLPRVSGALGLLDAAPSADVVFCAHTGFEGVMNLPALVAGKLVGRTIRVWMWRVPAADIPRDVDGRADWLMQQWRRVDREVASAQEVGTSG